MYLKNFLLVSLTDLVLASKTKKKNQGNKGLLAVQLNYLGLVSNFVKNLF